MPESALCVSDADIILPTFQSIEHAEAWYMHQMRVINTFPCDKLRSFLAAGALSALQAAYK